MLSMFCKHFFIFFILVIYFLPTSFAAPSLYTQKDTLRVGVTGNEPFVFKGKNEGIAIEIWQKISALKSWNYKLVPFDNTEDALHNLDNGNLDVVVGPISITAKRLESMRFSQPFYNSSISIMSRKDNPTIWQKVKPFFV